MATSNRCNQNSHSQFHTTSVYSCGSDTHQRAEGRLWLSLSSSSLHPPSLWLYTSSCCCSHSLKKKKNNGRCCFNLKSFLLSNLKQRSSYRSQSSDLPAKRIKLAGGYKHYTHTCILAEQALSSSLGRCHSLPQLFEFFRKTSQPSNPLLVP